MANQGGWETYVMAASRDKILKEAEKLVQRGKVEQAIREDEKLLKQIKKRFGDPIEYRGDPFHIVIGWKWSFVDQDNNRISLTLQHNSGDQNAKTGNSIKLTMTSLIEKDQICYKENELNQREKLRLRNWKVMDLGLEGWDRFAPR